MKDTYGPLFSSSSPHEDLQRSLGNKLRARLEGRGSPEYALTWKAWDIASGPPICALRASGRRTSDKGSTGWPTSKACDGTGHPSGMRYDEAGNPMPDALTTAAPLAAGWPTSTTRDTKNAGHPESAVAREEAGHAQPLTEIVQRVEGWPKTPQASDGEGGVMEIRPGTPGKYKLRDYAQTAGWGTPTKGNGERGGSDPSERAGHMLNLQDEVNLAKAAPGLTPASSPAPTAPRVVLDAAFSRWLMGYPEAWDKASPNFDAYEKAQALIATEGLKATEMPSSQL